MEEWYGGIQRSQIGVNQLNPKLGRVAVKARDNLASIYPSQPRRQNNW
jgi:hypothetical protein